MIQQLRNLMTEVSGEPTEVSKVVCSKPKTSDQVSRQVSTSIDVSKDDTEVCLIGCWCRFYQGCRYCSSNQLKVKTKIPVVEGLSMLTLQSLLNASVVFKAHRTLALSVSLQNVSIESSQNVAIESSQ